MRGGTPVQQGLPWGTRMTGGERGQPGLGQPRAGAAGAQLALGTHAWGGAGACAPGQHRLASEARARLVAPGGGRARGSMAG